MRPHKFAKSTNSSTPARVATALAILIFTGIRGSAFVEKATAMQSDKPKAAKPKSKPDQESTSRRPAVTVEAIRTISTKAHAILGMTLLNNGRQAITVAFESVDLWDLRDGKHVKTLGKIKPHLNDNRFSSSDDGTKLFFDDFDNQLHVWQVKSSSVEKRVIAKMPNMVSCACSDFEGGLLVSSDFMKGPAIWSADNGKKIGKLKTPMSEVPDSCAVSKQHDIIFLGLPFGEILLFNTTSEKPKAMLQGHEANIECLNLSADGKYLLSGSWDNEARIWDVASRKTLHVLKGHQSHILGVCFSKHATFAATASHDGTVRIWHVDSGQEVAVLRGHEGSVHCVAFANNTLVSAGADTTIRTWKLTVKEASADKNP